MEVLDASELSEGDELLGADGLPEGAGVLD